LKKVKKMKAVEKDPEDFEAEVDYLEEDAKE